MYLEETTYYTLVGINMDVSIDLRNNKKHRIVSGKTTPRLQKCLYSFQLYHNSELSNGNIVSQAIIVSSHKT